MLRKRFSDIDLVRTEDYDRLEGHARLRQPNLGLTMDSYLVTNASSELHIHMKKVCYDFHSDTSFSAYLVKSSRSVSKSPDFIYASDN